MTKQKEITGFEIPKDLYDGPMNVKDAQEGVDYAQNAQKLAIKVLCIAYNSQITKLLKESILKSQEIDRLAGLLKKEGDKE